MLIAIEGIDGSGKGTQAQKLVERTQNLGYTSALLSFPRYKVTHCSKIIASYLNGEFGSLQDVPPAFAATLFAMDRLESRSHIEQMLQQFELVIVDRYVGSNLAYQSARITMPERVMFSEWLFQLEYEVYALPKPDLTLFLDVPVVTSKKLVGRKGRRNYTEEVYDLHERDTDYLSNVREVYQWLIRSEVLSPCRMINCQAPNGEMRGIDEIGDDVSDVVIHVARNHGDRMQK